MDKDWIWFIGLAIGVPLILYLFGYFWTRGSMKAKKEFLDDIINPNEGEDK